MRLILGNVDMSIKIIVINGIGNILILESANWILNNSNNLENKISNNTKNIIEFLNLDTILNEETIEKDPQDLLPDYIGNKITFNSNMLTEEALTDEDLRLLTVDNPLVLPIHTTIRLLITSHDVLHSWAVPAFGIKTDACPARLNQVFVNIFRNGVFYGQCSELCGVQHGFMPIQVIVADL
jgi:heme/copper-type cytochrome/quinol oxidase subunit 2